MADADSPVALSKNLNKSKVIFPCHMSEKVDGIAIRMDRHTNITRQTKAFTSIGHIQQTLAGTLPSDDWFAVGELHVPGLPFKESSGIIRRKDTNDPRIKLMLYDIINRKSLADEFKTRLGYIRSFTQYLSTLGECDITPPKLGKLVYSWGEVDHHYAYIKSEAKKEGYIPEGYILRNREGSQTQWAEGKRTWGMMRKVERPKADLRVVNIKEATANKTMTFLGEEFNEGDGLRAVGRIEVEYKGNAVGVGPGKMTHKERREYYENPALLFGLIVEVEYKYDPTYDAMREPTFVRIRDDKTEPDKELL